MKQSLSHRAITWRAPQFVFKKKTLLWYTHVSVFMFVVLIFLFLAHNWAGALIVALLYWLFLTKSGDRPKIIDYKLDADGVTADDQTIDYSSIASFSLDTATKDPIILLELNTPMAIPVTLLVPTEQVEAVTERLLQHVPLNPRVSLLRRLTHLLHY